MAYSTMTTRSAGYVVPASEWNQLIANDEACATAGITTKGDLWAGTGSKAGARLAAGADYFSPAYLASKTNGVTTAPNDANLDVDSYTSLVASSTAENVISTTSLPANWLWKAGGLANVLIYEILVDAYNDTGGGVSFAVKHHYGGSSITVTFDITDNGTGFAQIYSRFILCGLGATNAQRGVHWYSERDPAGSGISLAMYATADWTVNSASAQTAKTTVTMGTNNAQAKFRTILSRITAVPAGSIA